MNPVINFFPPDFDIIGDFNTWPELPVFIADYGYHDIVIDNDGLIFFAGKFNHHASPCSVLHKQFCTLCADVAKAKNRGINFAFKLFSLIRLRYQNEWRKK